MIDITGKRIWVAGETGMVGRALLRQLKHYDCRILSAPHKELDLRDRKATDDWIFMNSPHIIIMAAARVGGIGANMANNKGFLTDNKAMSENVIQSAYTHGVEKLIYLGSSCIYPKYAPQPIKEDYLMTGNLEETNEGYALAKLAGVKMSEYYHDHHDCIFTSPMPTNLYGPHDKFDPDKSHVIPAMIYKFHRAKIENQKTVILWGTGAPYREFLHVDDLARAIMVMLKHYDQKQPINIGSGEEISIHDLAIMIKKIIGYEGDIEFDPSMPDGTPRKLLDSSKIRALGWEPTITLENGLKDTYDWFIRSYAS